MSELDRIRDSLRRAALDGPGTGRDIAYDTPVDGAVQVLRLAGGAVLARRYRLGFADGSELVADAAGRRLMRLAGPAPKGLKSEQAALFRRDRLTADDATALAGLLVALCERGTQFSVATAAPPDGIDPAQTGIGPDAVLNILGAAPDDPGPGDAAETGLDAYLASAGELFPAAILIRNEEISVLQDSDDRAATLIGWADSVLTHLISSSFPLLGTLETNGIMAFAQAGAEAPHILTAGHLGNYLVAFAEPANVAPALDRWRALHAA